MKFNDILNTTLFINGQFGYKDRSVFKNSFNRQFYTEDIVSDFGFMETPRLLVWSDCMETALAINHAYTVEIYESAINYERNDATDMCTKEYADAHYFRYDDSTYFLTSEALEDQYRFCDRICSDDVDDWDDNGNPISDACEDIKTGLLREYKSRDHIDMDAFFEEINAGSFPALGVELEVYAAPRSLCLESIRESYSEETLLLEYDGSLDRDCGFEIITPPFGADEWKVFAKNLLEKLKNNDVKAFTLPAGSGYGIHISIHRRHLTPLAEGRMLMFLSAEENCTFVQAIAQRKDIFDADRSIGKTELKEQKFKHCGKIIDRPFDSITGSNSCRKLGGCGKYTPLNLKEDLAEFRIFQSTINYFEFMKNLEFVWALAKWTRPESATGNSWHYKDFLSWLTSVQHKGDYPNLIHFLKKQCFSIRGRHEIATIDSCWQELI